ncbi:hypothetical protein [Prescottella equi]|uniref:hypothetical protein n=1 Tax=Rhodococcus hoagii TaxID=43767 RepID=UPI000D111B65|nr:hypothetical protein [Prescottella equi]AVP71358.1 hypothetical protein C7H75_25075 [Prescottella equi]MBM4469932.1 hypothetical protein [Prescottella equi]NKZ84537.1 hypothetical protein [Prescottella equi]NKZ86547.1 hypothetical protein [Prescottella equi]NKZ86554.1 hypothetical protein [Prescottella equi]
MRYSPGSNNLHEVPLRSEPLARLTHRKAQAGADFWTANSRIRTGYNASHVRVLDGRNAAGTARVSTVYADGYYAKWREIGTRYNAPERVLRQSIAAIRAAS